MSKREFSLRLLRILARQFVVGAQEGNSKKCRLIFYSMLNACRAFEDCTVKVAQEIVAEVVKDQIEKTATQRLAPMKMLKACLKEPMSWKKEVEALGMHLVSDADFYGYAEEGAQ